MAKPSPSHAGSPALVEIGKAVRKRRLRIDLSQEGLALVANIDRSYAGGIERGEHNFTVISLIKLADSLQMKPSELLRAAGL